MGYKLLKGVWLGGGGCSGGKSFCFFFLETITVIEFDL